MDELSKYDNWERQISLGKGSYGEVSMWQNIATKQKVAIKKCPVHKRDPPERQQKIKERWMKEYKIMHEVDEKNNIVRGVPVESSFLNALNESNSNTLPVLVMEYCDGGDLRKFLHQTRNSNGLKEREVKSVLQALFNAVNYLHGKNITHRDLKPENIVIEKKNDGNIYKITDFGYAKDMIGTNINSQVGTVGYFAPEVLLEGKYSPTVDYWSMGIIAFEIVCGCRPFIPHSTIMKWAELLKIKEASTLAITENNDDIFEPHSNIFNENQISNVFKEMIERWLVFALDFSHKRGLQPVPVSGAPNEVRSNVFFKLLHEIVTAQILTVFCISTYKFLSYELNQETTFDELFLNIHRDTQIPQKNLFIILTPDQNLEATKPIDWIIDGLEPMIFVAGIPRYFPDFENTHPYISKIIKDSLPSCKPMKSFYLMDLAKNVVFFRRNENRHYTNLLAGLRHYTIFLNHEIFKHQGNIQKLSSEKNQIIGALQHLGLVLNHSKKKLEEKNIAHIYVDCAAKWEKSSAMIGQDVQKFLNLCSRLEKRYDSVLRRSKELLTFPLFQQLTGDTNTDFFNVESLEQYYNNLRREFGDVKNVLKLCPVEKTRKLFEFFYATITTRSKLLQSKSLSEVQNNLADIHEEFMKIANILTNALKHIRKLIDEIREWTLTQQDEIYTIIESSAVEKYKKIQEHIPDFESLMSSLQLEQSQNGIYPIHFQLGSNTNENLMMDMSSFGEGTDAKSLTEENEEIRESVHHLLQDIDMSISSLRNVPQEDYTSNS